MAEKLKIGILGCGDYLKGQSEEMAKSEKVEVKSLFDPDKSRAEKYAEKLGGTAVDSDDAIFNDPEIDIVCLFVPPWIRRGQIEKACKAGKHIITTKPLGPTIDDCAAMVKAVEDAGVVCGVGYRRTGNAGYETYRKIFESGEIGKLAMMREDWLHHYPEWNTWALDPEKNGGPFMDAMIHNMNIARYLMGRKATHATFFSDNLAHPDLKCNDTESMKLDFEDGGTALLFITWAADLEVFSKDGNNREHIDVTYMITDQGWYVTEGWGKEGFTITASKEGVKKSWVAEGLPQTYYDGFVDAVAGGALPSSLPSIREAYEDIKIMRDAEKSIGQRIALDLSL